MGDRISISFVNGREPESVSLFSHWGGKEFLGHVREYLKERTCESHTEPNAVMVDFIMWFPTEAREHDFLYLGKDSSDGDNSDNGHHEVNIENGRIKKVA